MRPLLLKFLLKLMLVLAIIWSSEFAGYEPNVVWWLIGILYTSLCQAIDEAVRGDGR